MRREQVLHKRLRSQEALSEAVSAMKSLSAHHFRTARREVKPAREYRDGVGRVISALNLPLPVAQTGGRAVLAVGADRGLCGSYSAQVAKKVLKVHADTPFGRAYAIGRRGITHLSRGGLTVSRVYAAPASVAGITGLLLESGRELLRAYLDRDISSLDVVFARFEGLGTFTPVCVRVLPVPSSQEVTSLRVSEYVSREHLATVALREFLHSTLYEILIDALASEHGARLTATSSAEEWLDERIAATRRELSAVRRETSTQEVLDIAAGARQRFSQR